MQVKYRVLKVISKALPQLFVTLKGDTSCKNPSFVSKHLNLTYIKMWSSYMEHLDISSSEAALAAEAADSKPTEKLGPANTRTGS